MKLYARFSFFAVVGFLICTDREGTAFLCMAACLLHELGHIALMCAEGEPPESVTLYGGGIVISGGSKSVPVTAAGVCVNLSLFLLFGAVPWQSVRLRLFGMINLLTALFNLLPIRELDGKQLLDRILTKCLPPHTAITVADACEKIFTALLIPAAVILVFSGMLNVSALIFFFYIFAVEILEKL